MSLLLLFTSNSAAKYIRDALAAAAYPAGHVLRFRYDKRYVRRELLVNDANALPAKWAMIVYAEASDPQKEFDFTPIRMCTVARVEQAGSAVFIDVVLGDYPTLAGDSAFTDFQAWVKHPGQQYPLPRLLDGKGLGWHEAGESRVVQSYSPGDWAGNYFDARAHSLPSTVAPRTDRLGWEAVVDALSKTSLGQCPFFRVDGLAWRRKRLRNFVDERVTPKQRWPEIDYRLPAGQHIVIRIDTYHPAASKPFVLRVSSKGEGIAGIAPETISIDSRYDACRILVATKRVLEDVLSPLEVSASWPDDGEPNVSVPNPWNPSSPYPVQLLMPRWCSTHA